MLDNEILEKYKDTIESHINELLIEKNITDPLEIKAFSKKYKENFVVGFRQGMAKEETRILKNMLTLGLDIEVISKATNLTKEEIEKISKN